MKNIAAASTVAAEVFIWPSAAAARVPAYPEITGFSETLSAAPIKLASFATGNF